MLHIIFVLLGLAFVAFIIVPIAVWLLVGVVALIYAPFVAFRDLMTWIFKPRGKREPPAKDDADWMQDFSAWLINRR
jgi:hypothetical protein